MGCAVLRERVVSQNLGLEKLCPPAETRKFCGSINIIKRGFRRNKHDVVQRFSCKDCGRRFVVNVDGFHKAEYNPKIITLALDLYFKGASLRKIVDHIKQFYGLALSHVCVLKWIRKYVALMKAYVDELKPQIGEVWHADEMTVNINGEYKWLWNLMDSDTRFLLAMQISKKREAKDARKVFQEAKEKAQIKPVAVITDDLRAYEDAVKKEFFTLRNPRTKHIGLASIRDIPTTTQ